MSTDGDDWQFPFKVAQGHPEKIILVIDTIQEFNATHFETKDGQKFRPLSMIQKATHIFLHHKDIFGDKEHTFAMVSLGQRDPHWQCDFTNDIQKLVKTMNNFEEPRLFDQKPFNLQQVFNLIHKRIVKDDWIQENIVYRIILIYARSHSMPIFEQNNPLFEELMSNNNLFLDILYVHEPVNKAPKCKEIYSALLHLTLHGRSYYFEVGRNAMKLHEYMADLLSHPLQRLSLKDRASFREKTLVDVVLEKRKAKAEESKSAA